MLTTSQQRTVKYRIEQIDKKIALLQQQRNKWQELLDNKPVKVIDHCQVIINEHQYISARSLTEILIARGVIDPNKRPFDKSLASVSSTCNKLYLTNRVSRHRHNGQYYVYGKYQSK